MPSNAIAAAHVSSFAAIEAADVTAFDVVATSASITAAASAVAAAAATSTAVAVVVVAGDIVTCLSHFIEIQLLFMYVSTFGAATNVIKRGNVFKVAKKMRKT